MSHISSTIVGTEGMELDGKTIIHCITSSISCFLAPQISRLLMRHGAKVIPVMSPEAAKFINPMIFEWATGIEPIVQIEGKVEHVQYAGLSEDKADLVLIAPITANSISKIANGIMDTSVTLVAGTALGNKIPMIMVPTMHEVMMYNPAIEENIKRLEEMGVQVLMPLVEEEKAKIPGAKEILYYVMKEVSEQTLQGRKILVNAGPTRAYLDGIRFISNPSSGKMGFALAIAAWKRGADVKLVYGATSIEPPRFLTDVCKNETPDAMYEEVITSLSDEYDYVILAAAMNDFKLEKPLDSKVKSVDTWDLQLTPVRKLADKIKEISPESKLVLFKAEYKKTDEELVKIAVERMERAQADMIVANEVSTTQFGFESDFNRVGIVSLDKKTKWVEGTKSAVASSIISLLD